MKFVHRLFTRKRERLAEDRESMARLEEAEGQLQDLRQRHNDAVGSLSARHKRNHWRESIEEMITGAI